MQRLLRAASGARALQGTAALPVRDAVEDKAQWGREAGEHVAEWRRNLDLKAWADEVRTVEREERTYPQGEGKGDVKLLNTLLFAPQHNPFSYVPYLEYRVGLG